jgi:hypothetical protein
MPTTKTSLKKLCRLRSKLWDEAFLLCIPEKSGSKLGRETGYPDRDFSVLQTKLWNIRKTGRDRILLRNLEFIARYHPFVRRYSLRDWQRIIKKNEAFEGCAEQHLEEQKRTQLSEQTEPNAGPPDDAAMTITPRSYQSSFPQSLGHNEIWSRLIQRLYEFLSDWWFSLQHQLPDKILSLNSVNQLIFVMVKCSVLSEVRTEFLNNI